VRSPSRRVGKGCPRFTCARRGCSTNSASVTPDGSFRKRLATIAKVDLVLIDDFAIAPMGARERTDLLELLDDRVGTRSTLITSQLPVEHWHDYLGDPTLADAILDRLVHSAHKLHLEGESMRKRTAASADKTPATKKKVDGA
jgi:DNA replication protein DnaC